MSEMSASIRNMHRGFLRIHILCFAVNDGEVHGAMVTRKLAEFGFRVSPGTLYPTLHEMEDSGFLEGKRLIVGGKVRKSYTITQKGTDFLYHMKPLITALTGVLMATRLPGED